MSSKDPSSDRGGRGTGADAHPFLGMRHIGQPIEPFLAGVGEIFATFRDRDSKNTCYGLTVAGRRWFVKHADHPDAMAHLESALRFHALVSHPAIIPVEGCLRTPQGLALVHEWREGEILNDPSAPGALPRGHPDSAFARFRRLPVPEILAGVDTIFDVHLEVVRRGFVAVDFYDGTVIYDFVRRRLHLLDLDAYRPGPYVLERDRQHGSERFMAPEEFRRGETIDERTTVYTLGRTAFVFLSTGLRGETEPGRWRGSPEQYAVARKATADDPAARFASVGHLVEAWRAAPTAA